MARSLAINVGCTLANNNQQVSQGSFSASYDATNYIRQDLSIAAASSQTLTVPFTPSEIVFIKTSAAVTVTLTPSGVGPTPIVATVTNMILLERDVVSVQIANAGGAAVDVYVYIA